MLKGDGKYSALQKNRIFPMTTMLPRSTLVSPSSAARVENTHPLEGERSLAATDGKAALPVTLWSR